MSVTFVTKSKSSKNCFERSVSRKSGLRNVWIFFISFFTNMMKDHENWTRSHFSLKDEPSNSPIATCWSDREWVLMCKRFFFFPKDHFKSESFRFCSVYIKNSEIVMEGLCGILLFVWLIRICHRRTLKMNLLARSDGPGFMFDFQVWKIQNTLWNAGKVPQRTGSTFRGC